MKQHISRYLLTLVALFAMTTGAWAEDLYEEFTTNTGASVYTGQHFKITPHAMGVGDSDGFCIYYDFPATIEALNGETITKVEFTTNDTEGLLSDDGTVTYNGNVATVSGVNATSMTVIADNYIFIRAVKVYGTAGPEVTYNDAKTTASFEMPAYDATVDYELVRDMAVDVDATIADRIRIKKDASSSAYVAVTATELIPAVSDKISGTAVAMTVTTDYTVKLQKKVEGDAPSWADAEALSVGTFRYVITGTGLYDGEITTTEFQLFEGYEVTVPAGEYATYYRTDDNLKIDGENTGGKLYTITGVSGSTATATEITSANKEMPFLIYNGNTEAKTFLLIPTDTEIDQTFYAGFVGTAEDTNILASSAEQNNYAFNGKQFVWVKTEIPVGANKCWLAIPTGVTSNAREINLVFGNTTGIESIDNSELTIDGWYDLNGRKLQGKPTKKGIYIHNGKKVVVK